MILNFIRTQFLNISLYVVIIGMSVAIYFIQKSKIDKVKLENKVLVSQVDSLKKDKEYTNKLVDLNTEVLSEKNKSLIEKKEEYEKKISVLDTTDTELNYQKNLLTIKEYLRDRKRFNIKE